MSGHGATVEPDIRIHCIWNRARYIVYTVYLEQISDIQAYCIYIVFGNGLDTLYIPIKYTLYLDRSGLYYFPSRTYTKLGEGGRQDL